MSNSNRASWPASERTSSFPKKSSKKVATLYINERKLRALDQQTAEEEQQKKIPLPRWKSTIPVYYKFSEQVPEDHVATVHLSHLGLAYNIRRLFGEEELYIIAT
ncbi:hypothetical protein FQN53_000925 [Emmonsiellopsis sp. PD_33]|nr:hypothetical protein FQN53_000925 [Emmonsiellopsis sp. PD_33]